MPGAIPRATAALLALLIVVVAVAAAPRMADSSGLVARGRATVASPERTSFAAPGRLLDDPAIEVWFEEGCDGTFAIGTTLHLLYRANVTGMARVWRFPDEELFLQDWLEAGVTHEIVGPVTGPPGRWWILGELLASGATATCHYTTTEAAATATPTVTVTATATATVTATPTATVTATPTATVTATLAATAETSATAAATETATDTATPAATTAETPDPAPTPSPHASEPATVTETATPSETATATRPPSPAARLFLPLAYGSLPDDGRAARVAVR